MIIPFLWKNPWKYLKEGNDELLIKIIISKYLSDKLNQEINILKGFSYQKPLFDYISYCRHLKLSDIEKIIGFVFEESEFQIIKKEIFNLFINGNTKFTHLYIPRELKYKLHPVPEGCFDGIEFLSCSTGINDDIIAALAERCKSIKELELFIENSNNNYEIIRLIEAQKRLSNINLNHFNFCNETFCKILENSFIKHANTIQYCQINGSPTISHLLP